MPHNIAIDCMHTTRTLAAWGTCLYMYIGCNSGLGYFYTSTCLYTGSYRRQNIRSPDVLTRVHTTAAYCCHLGGRTCLLSNVVSTLTQPARKPVYAVKIKLLYQ